MPKYRNDQTAGDMLIEGVDGDTIRLGPGESGESYLFYDRTDLTKTADAPLWTPYLAAPKTITAAEAGTETQAITAGTYRLRILSATVTVAVWIHNTTTAAHELLPSLAPEDCPYDLIVDERVGTLAVVFAGAGSVVIAEMGE